MEGISFSVGEGKFVGVIGPNGAGKTSLLKAVLGLIKPDRGEVFVFGTPPSGLGKKAHHIGYVPQKSRFDPRFPISVYDVVMMGRVCCIGLFRFPGKRDRELVAESLKRVGLEGYEHRPIGELSGGEQQRAFLARALCSQTRLLILDEPTTALDMPARQEFYRLLKELKDEMGLTVIMVCHDLQSLAVHSDELICINRTMHLHGRPQEVLKSTHLLEAYHCEFDFLSQVKEC
ncbi:MAG: metal ABC transporter ATP-binding protein [Nitrospinae bacterium]|nr:metal ABC transporter ATP-binding protein [Nitrospinota bacterium]